MRRKILWSIITLVAILNVNIVVKADSYCNYNSKKMCEDHNKYVGDKFDYYCEWKKVDNKNICALKCSKLGEQACGGYPAVCKWFTSDKKCKYFEEDEPSDVTAPVVTKDCNKIGEGECKNSANCRWDDANKTCRSACASLSKSNCNNSYCKWNDDNNKCREVCTKITNDSDCKLAECEWKNNKCYNKVSTAMLSKTPGVIDTSTYNNYDSEELSCGNKLITKIPKSLLKIIRIVYLIIQIAVPVVLVIFGMLDLFKGITAQKEDEIKSGQNLFIKRLMGAGMVFFVLTLVKLLIGFVADSNKNRIIDCVECFINSKCD